MDPDLLARELLRALRGRRSQRAFSRRLGYTTNVAWAWEHGERSPTAAETFGIAARVGVDLRASVASFFRQAPAWADTSPLDTDAGVARLLRELAGDTAVAELARRTGASRQTITRWLDGRTSPRLPEFLRLVDAACLRALDLVAALVDPRTLPSAAAQWETLEARRRLAWEHPWSQAVLRTLETRGYAELAGHDDGWVAGQLGIDVETARASLDALVRAGQVRWSGERWLVDDVLTVDTRPDPAAGRRMRRHWAEVGIARIEAEAPGQFSYNVFSVSKADFERIRQLHVAYFQALRTIVASSEPCEVVAVANIQLFELGPEPAVR